jgi:hypothetical protein
MEIDANSLYLSGNDKPLFCPQLFVERVCQIAWQYADCSRVEVQHPKRGAYYAQDRWV